MSTVISVALVLLIVGLIVIAYSLSHGANNSLRDDVALTVRLCNDVTSAQIDSIKAEIDDLPFVASSRFTSAEEVLQAEMFYNADVIEALGDNPFSPEFEVYMRPEFTASPDVADAAAVVGRLSGVDAVFYSTEVVESINAFLNRATLYLSILAVVMLIVSVALIFNTVSLAVYARRFLIHTMKLVGAKASFIRSPFIRSGVFLGALSGLLAGGVICAFHLYAEREGVDAVIFNNWLQTFAISGALVVIGSLFCGIAACIAASRYIRYDYDQLFMR